MRRTSVWVVAAAALMPLPLVAACGGGHDLADSAAKAPNPAAPAARTGTPAVVAETDIEQAGAERISVKGDWLAAGEGGVWLSTDTGIVRLDPASGDTDAEIEVPEGPCEATDVGFGALWTATCRTPGLAKIDPASNRVSAHLRLPIPERLDGEGSVGAGEGAVWLVTDGPDCTGCRVARVDPRTMRVTDRVVVKDGAATVRVGEGSVWVGNPAQNVVEQIDPATKKVVRTIKAGQAPRFLDVGEGAAWILNQFDGTVTRIDPATGSTTSVNAGVFGEGGDLTVGGGSVWARGADKLLTRIDPARRAVVARYGPSSGSAAVIVDNDTVWVSAHDINTVWRFPAP